MVWEGHVAVSGESVLTGVSLVLITVLLLHYVYK